MSLRDLFRSAFGVHGEEQYALAEADVPTITINGTTYNVLDFNPGDTYIDSLPALQRARQMTADTVASLPAVGYRNGSRLTDQPTQIRRPDPSLDTRTFVAETVLSLFDFGNAYWLVTYDEKRNQPIAAKVVDPTDITVYWDPTRTTRRYKLRSADIPNRNIRHLAMNRAAWELEGRGPMQSSRLSGLVSMLRYAQDYFTEASNPSGILTDPYDNDPNEAQDKLDAWEDGHDRGTRFLSGGLTFTPNTMKPGESDWVNSHAAGYVDIAVLTGIPVPLLGASLLGGSTSIVYQNLTTVYEQWTRDTLSPTYITPIEAAWSTLVPHGTHVELDTDKLTRRDRAGRIDDAVKTFQAGLITADEARSQIGYDTAPGPLPTAPQEPNREVANA